MSRTIQISPSLLSADFLNLERDVNFIASAKPRPEWLHLDIMDGHFVPNLTIGPKFVKSLRNLTDIQLDVHLMIDNPGAQLDLYLDAGTDLVTIHVESPAAKLVNAVTVSSTRFTHRRGTSFAISEFTPSQLEELRSLLERIRAAGAKAGVSLNPNTPIEVLEPLMGCFDLVLVMSVHPGFAGQSFIPSCVDKVAWLVARREALREGQAGLAGQAGQAGQAGAGCEGCEARDFLIEVDGGINAETAGIAAAAGADILVAGYSVFGADDPLGALAEIRFLAQEALG